MSHTPKTATAFRFVITALIALALVATPALARGVGQDQVKVAVSTCDLGQRCQMIEASSSLGSLSMVSSFSSTLDKSGGSGPSVFQQEIRIASRDLNTTLHFLVLSNFSGASQSASYMIDGEPVTQEEFIASYSAVEQVLPNLQLPTDALTRGTWLGCFKEVITDCGGTHNGGTCDNFSWSDGGDVGIHLCVQASTAGCSLAHPWSLFGCAAAILF